MLSRCKFRERFIRPVRLRLYETYVNNMGDCSDFYNYKRWRGGLKFDGSGAMINTMASDFKTGLPEKLSQNTRILQNMPLFYPESPF
jgi:hypothetical protein